MSFFNKQLFFYRICFLLLLWKKWRSFSRHLFFKFLHTFVDKTVRFKGRRLNYCHSPRMKKFCYDIFWKTVNECSLGILFAYMKVITKNMIFHYFISRYLCDTPHSSMPLLNVITRMNAEGNLVLVVRFEDFDNNGYLRLTH